MARSVQPNQESSGIFIAIPLDFSSIAAAQYRNQIVAVSLITRPERCEQKCHFLCAFALGPRLLSLQLLYCLRSFGGIDFGDVHRGPINDQPFNDISACRNLRLTERYQSN